jgi:hypothetical protein
MGNSVVDLGAAAVDYVSDVASDIGEDTLAGEATELIMTPAEARALAKEKMAEAVYQDKFHPAHDEAVQEVQRLFELASG